MKKQLTAILGGAAVLAVFSGAAPAANKAPETIMRANCGTCHGQLGQGGFSWVNPKEDAPRIAGKSTGNIKETARKGEVPEMPAFPPQEINDTELNNLANYINRLPGSYIPEPAAQATVIVTDEDPWYNPMQITVSQGHTVKFINTGRTYHPVTQLDFVVSRGASGTDSGMLGPDGVYYRAFNESVGTKLTFLCKVHPYMRGEVYVGVGFTPPAYHVDEPKPLPAAAGVGEIWVEAQYQDYPGRVKDGVVQIIDAADWRVTHLIPVGNNPHNIWLNRGGTEAVVTNWFDNTISRINAGTKRVIGDVIVGASNAHIISDFSGENFYVTVEGSYYVQAVRQSGYELSKRVWVGGYGPHGIWYGASGDRKRILVANSMDNTATIIDAKEMKQLATLPADLYPLGSGTNTTGTKGYVGNNLAGTVSVYDLVNLRKIKDIYVGGGPVQVPVSPDDRYAVVGNSPYATVISTATDAVVAQFWAGKGAHGVAFARKADGSGWYACVTHKFENYVSVIDLSNMTYAGDVPLVTTTTGKVAIVGATDTGGQGVLVRPLYAPWR